MRRVISLFKVTNAIVNLSSPLNPTAHPHTQSERDRDIRTIFRVRVSFLCKLFGKVKAGNPFLDDMLKLKLYEATKGGVRGVGRYCTGVDNILVSAFVCVCVCVCSSWC